MIIKRGKRYDEQSEDFGTLVNVRYLGSDVFKFKYRCGKDICGVRVIGLDTDSIKPGTTISEEYFDETLRKAVDIGRDCIRSLQLSGELSAILSGVDKEFRCVERDIEIRDEGLIVRILIVI